MKKLLLLLLCVPLIFSCDNMKKNKEEHEDLEFLYRYQVHYDLDSQWIFLSNGEKIDQGYIDTENEIKLYFGLKEHNLYFSKHLIGDLNGDQIDDFIVFHKLQERWLFKISDGRFFSVFLNQEESIDWNNKDEEIVISIFFKNINNGVLEVVLEDKYYNATYDEFCFPITSLMYTLDDILESRRDIFVK